MSTDSDLQNNYYYYCLLYSRQNSSPALTQLQETYFVSLAVDSSSNIYIETWNSNCTQPTNTQLKTYTPLQAADQQAAQQAEVYNSSYNTPNLDSQAISYMSFLANGNLVYNTTTNKLQLYANGSWVNLN